MSPSELQEILEETERRVQQVQGLEIETVDDLSILEQALQLIVQAKDALQNADPDGMHSGEALDVISKLELQLSQRASSLGKQPWTIGGGREGKGDGDRCDGREGEWLAALVSSCTSMPLLSSMCSLSMSSPSACASCCSSCLSSSSSSCSRSTASPSMPETDPPSPTFIWKPDNGPNDMVVEEKKEPARPESLMDRVSFERKVRKTIYGEVYFGHYYTGEAVAIKLSYKAKLQSMRALEDPFEEVRMMKNLQENYGNHPNLLKFFEAGETTLPNGREVYYSVTEFCMGGELFDIVAEQGRVDEDKAKAIFRQLMSALEFIFDCGVCHLDISLENILLRQGVDIALIDFGMARTFDNSADFEAPRIPPGKIQYQAPEVHAKQPYNGMKADLYSCGVVLFILVAGTPPYQFPSESDRRFGIIYSGRLLYLLQRWRLDSLLSESLVNLLQALLGPPESRPSLEEIKAHPWLQ